MALRAYHNKATRSWIYHSGVPLKSLEVGIVTLTEQGFYAWKFNLPSPRPWKISGEVLEAGSAQAAIRRVWKRWLEYANLSDVKQGVASIEIKAPK